MLKQIVALIIGYALLMYVYAIPDKTYFDFISQLFSFVTLALLLEHIVKAKDWLYACIIGAIMANFLYAMGKQLAGVGTQIISFDYFLWWFIPITLVGCLVLVLIKTFRNGK